MVVVVVVGGTITLRDGDVDILLTLKHGDGELLFTIA